ncbi:MAG: ribosome assembly cofactor RimP [Bacteroidales bacterium]|nr:ribosome assembly cofactor RimP [Candidatus Colimorpha onthohippi]
MIDKLTLLEIVEEALNGTDKYVVNIKVTANNCIYVDIDGDHGINVDDCIELSRTIESKLDRDVEDFELTVSSAGADSPLKLPRQYVKNEGRLLSITLLDGTEYEATLTDAGESEITVRTKGTKKEAPKTISIAYSDIRKACVIIKI